MNESKVPGATLEEICAEITKAIQRCERALQDAHIAYLAQKSHVRSVKAATLKELRSYRAIIERKLKQQGGSE